MTIPIPSITIHIYTSGEQGLFANAYLIETSNGVVAIDGTLTHSESQAFRTSFMISILSPGTIWTDY